MLQEAAWVGPTPNETCVTFAYIEDGHWKTNWFGEIWPLLLMCHQDPNFPVENTKETTAVKISPTQANPTNLLSTDTKADATTISAGECFGAGWTILTVLAAALHMLI